MKQLSSGALYAGMLQPAANKDLLEALRAQGVSAFSMESVPRISRAQVRSTLHACVFVYVLGGGGGGGEAVLQ